jgi:hypothetical protein
MMVFRPFSSHLSLPPQQRSLPCAVLLTLVIGLVGQTTAGGQLAVPSTSKNIIGATDTFTEVGTGIPFSARIDTGAKSCSLHVEKMEIKDEAPKRLQNIGKTVRFLIKGENGKSEWIETTIAGAVRVKSSVFKDGEFDRRYKVRLTLRWKEFEKEVLVTLNDRADMEYPLLIGRNYLRGDFLVDVAKKADE